MVSGTSHPTQVVRMASTHASGIATSKGDLNNTSSMRQIQKPIPDPSYAFQSLAISASEEDAEFRNTYRPFIQSEQIETTDWVSQLELATVTKMAREDFEKTGERLRVLVLYGSLRKR